MRTALGYASSKYGSSNARAAELCERVGYPPEYAGISYGLHYFYLYRGDLPHALETAERLLREARAQNDIRGQILGHISFGRAKHRRIGEAHRQGGCRSRRAAILRPGSRRCAWPGREALGAQ